MWINEEQTPCLFKLEIKWPVKKQLADMECVGHVILMCVY